MNNNKTILAMFLATCLGVFSTSASATVVDIDLNDFFADLSVVVEADGSSAKISEDACCASVILSNDPSFFDPNVIIPSAGALLKFDYDFTEGTDNDDEFFAAVLDGSGLSILGFELTLDATTNGSISWDISSLVGPLGLHFQLDSFENPFDSSIHLASMVTVSNVRIETPDVPIPPVTGLMFLSLVWLNIARRSRKVNKLLNK